MSKKSARVVFCFGLRFDCYELPTIINMLINRNQRDATCKILVTPNVDHIVSINRDDSFYRVYSESDFIVNDSRILLILSRLIGLDLKYVTPGSDITRELMDVISVLKEPITIVGCSHETVQSIKEKFKLVKISHYNPPMGFIDDPAEVKRCVNFIIESNSRFTFLAVGSPRQEILAHTAKAAGATGNILCIGASLLFLSGEENRAPKLIQTLSLEWLFRLLQSPKRLAKRYLIKGPAIFPIAFKEYIKRKNGVSN